MCSKGVLYLSWIETSLFFLGGGVEGSSGSSPAMAKPRHTKKIWPSNPVWLLKLGWVGSAMKKVLL